MRKESENWGTRNEERDSRKGKRRRIVRESEIDSGQWG